MRKLWHQFFDLSQNFLWINAHICGKSKNKNVRFVIYKRFNFNLRNRMVTRFTRIALDCKAWELVDVNLQTVIYSCRVKYVKENLMNNRSGHKISGGKFYFFSLYEHWVIYFVRTVSYKAKCIDDKAISEMSKVTRPQ